MRECKTQEPRRPFLNSSISQFLNFSTPQLLNSSTPQLLNSSTPRDDQGLIDRRTRWLIVAVAHEAPEQREVNRRGIVRQG